MVEQNLVSSRQKAIDLIVQGRVSADGQKVYKPSDQIAISSAIVISFDRPLWVSRAAEKLSHALDSWALSVEAATCLDVGASTGGFTQVLLSRGAKHIYAVDVGHGQLAERLRQDPRVDNLERNDVRSLTSEIIHTPIDFCSIDVAFISIQTVLPVIVPFLSSKGQVLALVKPQFEVGKAHLSGQGIVKDSRLFSPLLKRVQAVGKQSGLTFKESTISPILGRKGNREFLMYFEKSVRQDMPFNK